MTANPIAQRCDPGASPHGPLHPRRPARAGSRLGLLALLALSTATGFAGAPPNDNIATAVVVTAPLPFTHAVATVEATTAADDPECAGNGPTVWYVFTPAASGWIKADTFGSDYDTTLSAYTGAPGSLTQVACNDDSGSLQSRVLLQVTAGTTYYFMAGAFGSGPGGDLDFNVDVSAPPAVVTLTVAQPVVVVPATGAAKVQLQVNASPSVFIIQVQAVLVQPSGRGNIVAGAGALIREETDAYALTLTLKDTLSQKRHGTGFVGGKARLQTTLVYDDPAAGIQVQTSDQEVQLQGGNGK